MSTGVLNIFFLFSNIVCRSKILYIIFDVNEEFPLKVYWVRLTCVLVGLLFAYVVRLKNKLSSSSLNGNIRSLTTWTGFGRTLAGNNTLPNFGTRYLGYFATFFQLFLSDLRRSIVYRFFVLVRLINATLLIVTSIVTSFGHSRNCCAITSDLQY